MEPSVAGIQGAYGLCPGSANTGSSRSIKGGSRVAWMDGELVAWRGLADSMYWRFL